MTEVYKVINTIDNVNVEPLFTKPHNSRMRSTQTSMRHAEKSRHFFYMAHSKPLEFVDMSLSKQTLTARLKMY